MSFTILNRAIASMRTLPIYSFLVSLSIFVNIRNGESGKSGAFRSISEGKPGKFDAGIGYESYSCINACVYVYICSSFRVLNTVKQSFLYIYKMAN